MTAHIEFGARDLTIRDVWRLAAREAAPRIGVEALARVARSAAHVETALARDGVIYGVTTGYGESCTAMLGEGVQALRDVAPFLTQDVPLDGLLQDLTARIAAQAIPAEWPELAR